MRIKLLKNRVSKDLRRIQRDLVSVPEKTAEEWVRNTPIQSGNARRSTVFRGKTLTTNYDYAVPLDKGHSKQSPKGMTKPAFAYFKKTVDRIMKG